MFFERMDDSLLVAGLLLVVGLALGTLNRKAFNPGWLMISVGLVLLYDLIYASVGTVIPYVLWESRWNWQSKFITLFVLLAIAAHPAFGLRKVGVTLKQDRDGLRAVMPFVAIYAAFFIGWAVLNPPTNASMDTIAFQLTMPSLDEELFYRGILLFALYKTFAGRVKLFGVEWGWGALLSSILFGLAHAFHIRNGA